MIDNHIRVSIRRIQVVALSDHEVVVTETFATIKEQTTDRNRVASREVNDQGFIPQGSAEYLQEFVVTLWIRLNHHAVRITHANLTTAEVERVASATGGQIERMTFSSRILQKDFIVFDLTIRRISRGS